MAKGLTKFKLYHAHRNPLFGKKRDEAVAIIVDGPKDKCAECLALAKAKAKKKNGK